MLQIGVKKFVNSDLFCIFTAIKQITMESHLILGQFLQLIWDNKMAIVAGVMILTGC